MPVLLTDLSFRPLTCAQLAELLLKAQEAAKWSIQDILDRQDDPYTQDGYYMNKYNAYKAAAERYRSSAQVRADLALFPNTSPNAQAAISSATIQTKLLTQFPNTSSVDFAGMATMPFAPAQYCRH